MRKTARHGVYDRLSACLLAMVLVLSAVVGPLSLFLCRAADTAVSTQLHACCKKKDPAKLRLEAPDRPCCEKLKSASPAMPSLTVSAPAGLEVPWTPIASLAPALPVPSVRAVSVRLPLERGPPVDLHAPPVFLLNASFLC